MALHAADARCGGVRFGGRAVPRRGGARGARRPLRPELPHPDRRHGQARTEELSARGHAGTDPRHLLRARQSPLRLQGLLQRRQGARLYPLSGQAHHRGDVPGRLHGTARRARHRWRSRSRRKGARGDPGGGLGSRGRHSGVDSERNGRLGHARTARGGRVGGDRAMKISSLETFANEFVCFVRVTTETGAVGWGQTSTYHADISATLLHPPVAPWALGADALEIDALIDRIDEREHKVPGSYRCRALAGLDTALWDLRGKLEGRPVVELLGGRPRRLRAYASSMRRDIQPVDEAARLVRFRDAKGLYTFKWCVGAVGVHVR